MRHRPAGVDAPHHMLLVAELAHEGEKRARFAAGELGLDMYNMRGPLEKAGLKYID